MPSPEEIMLQLEQQVNEGLPDPRVEMMKKLLMGAVSPPMAMAGGGTELAKMLMGGQMLNPMMSAEGIEEALGDETGPGKARPAPSPDEKMRFMEVMKLMMMGPGMMGAAQEGAQAGGMVVPGAMGR